MNKEYLLERTQVIRRPLAEVFPFFADAANLEIITPPWLGFRILTPGPIEIQSGTLIDYRIALCGVPLKWRTRIESFETPVRFVDTQVWGPYDFWHHTHEFSEIPEGTRMVDRVRYRIPWGPIGELARWLFVDRQLKMIFDYRYAKIEELMNQRPSSSGQKKLVACGA